MGFHRNLLKCSFASGETQSQKTAHLSGSLCVCVISVILSMSVAEPAVMLEGLRKATFSEGTRESASNRNSKNLYYKQDAMKPQLARCLSSKNSVEDKNLAGQDHPRKQPPSPVVHVGLQHSCPQLQGVPHLLQGLQPYFLVDLCCVGTYPHSQHGTVAKRDPQVWHVSLCLYSPTQEVTRSGRF